MAARVEKMCDTSDTAGIAATASEQTLIDFSICEIGSESDAFSTG
jgi:hypothetical protein